MFDSLYISATGMQAQQTNLDAIANNLANLNTPAYKRTRVSFTDLVMRGSLSSPAGESAPLAPPTLTGIGVAVASSSKMFDVGDMQKTGSALDVAIQGDGFFELSMADGSRAYVRGGSLKVNADGQLATQDGVALKPGINIPDNAQTITIGVDGQVQVQVAGQTSLTSVGQLEMVRFTNPQGLLAQGDGVYLATDASGEPIEGKAGQDGMGTIAQGFVEGSNVKLVDEMVNLMVAQRAYEANTKVVQASDEMLGMINGLRR